MAKYDANINLLLNAQKAFKQIDALEKRIKGLSSPKTELRERLSAKTRRLVLEAKVQEKIAEQKLENQLRLNAALQRQETLVKNLTRAGVKGDRKTRVEELVNVSKQFPKKLGIQNAVNTALEKELQTQREINRTDRAQNATSSEILTSIKRRIQALKAVGATTAEINEVEKKRTKLIEQNDKKQTDLAKESLSQVDRKLASLERKYSTFLGKPGRQIASPLSAGPARTVLDTPQALKQKTQYYERIAKSIKPLSSPMRPQSVLGSDSSLRKKAEYYERIAKAAKTTAAPRSPIRGSATLIGSPKFLEAQAKRTQQQERDSNKRLRAQAVLRDKNARAAKRTADQVARKARLELQAARKAQGASIVGAGFPLLFGGGPGSIIGGALGGALGGQELGFELSIGLSAVGAVIDRLVGSARNLGNAFSSVDDTLNQVKQIGFNVNSATEKRVQLLLEEGRATEAFLLVLERTGIRPEQVNNLRELDSAFDELQDATAKLFVTVISELVPAITVVTNLITDFVKTLTGPEIQRAAANLDPQAFQAAQTQAATETSQFGVLGNRQAYEQRLTELSRGIVSANTPTVDTSQLEKINTFTRENLDLIEKRSAALKAGNDLSEEAAYIAARQIVFAQTRLEVAEAQGNREKIAIALARESLALDELRAQRQKDIEQFYKNQSRELEKQEALLRRIRDAQISAQLAKDIFLNQPLVDPTPFSRTSPEQAKASALTLQRLKYEAELAKINNQKLDVAIKEARLKEAEVNNASALRDINNTYTNAVKQREESFLTQKSALEFQLKIQTATTRQQADQLRLQQEMEILSRSGTFTEKQLQDIRSLKQALIDAQGPLKQFMTDTQRAINDLSDTEVQIVTAAQSIEREFGTAFQSIVTGTTSVQQAVSDMLLNIGRDFIAMATQIIAKQLVMITLQKTLGLFGGGGGRGGFGVPVLTSGLNFGGAFADGGRPAVGKASLVGERGPELFVPNRSGTIIPNDQLGGSSNTVTVNVDAKGTEVSGNSDQSRQLGAAISRAVQAELVKQQRPGGVLHSSR